MGTTALDAHARPSARVTFANIMRSEWIKFRSVRSLRLTLIGGLVALIVFGLIFSGIGADGATARPGADAVTEPLSISLFGMFPAQLVIGILGALIVVGEYSTGQIRSTFAAVPHRLSVLWAKAAVTGAVVFATGLVAIAITFTAGQEILGLDGPSVGFTDAGVPRALLGAAGSLAIIAIMGVALGFIVRRTAGAVGILLGTLFLAPTLVGLLPDSVSGDLVPYLPSNAAQATWQITESTTLLSPAGGAAVLVVYAIALLGAAAVLLRARDV
jgi:ABC-2 type transport system permease protein